MAARVASQPRPFPAQQGHRSEHPIPPARRHRVQGAEIRARHRQAGWRPPGTGLLKANSRHIDVITHVSVSSTNARVKRCPETITGRACDWPVAGVEHVVRGPVRQCKLPGMEHPGGEHDGAGEVSSSSAFTFADLAMDLHDASGVEETVQTVVDFAVGAVACDHAAVVLSTAGRPELDVGVGAASDVVVDQLSRAELAAGVGPLIEALRDRRVIAVGDAAAEARWPEWGAVMADHGVRSVLQVPLAVSERTIGVLSLYSAQPEAFGDDEFAVAHILARHASIAVATARQEETLARAVDARKLIGVAMGILMVRYDVDLDRAFEVLKRYSQHNNRKLRDVAVEVIETRSLPPSA